MSKSWRKADWENDLPSEYQESQEFGGNTSEIYKKHCFAKYCWHNRNTLVVIDHVHKSKITLEQFFLKQFGESVDSYRHRIRELAEQNKMEKLKNELGCH